MMALARTPPRLEASEPDFAAEVMGKIVRLIGAPNQVLLVGGSAALADALHVRGWQVVWVTGELAAATTAVSERITAFDLDNADWVAQFDDERFEAIVVVGLLEFVRDPAALLGAFRRILASQGQLVTIIPNIAHGDVRLALLGGHFPCAEWDHPERLPLRFYTRETIEALFASIGFEIRDVERRNAAISVPAVTDRPAAISDDLIRQLQEDPEALTSHFVVLARPANEERGDGDGLEDDAQTRADIELALRIDQQAEQVGALAAQVKLLERHLQTRHVASPDASILASLQAIERTLANLGSVDQPWWQNRRTAEPREVMRYHQILHRMRGIVRAVLPPEAVVLVVSRGDDALLDLDGRTGWHFPMHDDGAYAGHHPADSDEAIRHLEDLRARGAGFLLIPSTASWWLDYYADFARHLERCYRVVARRDDSGVIFRLQEG